MTTLQQLEKMQQQLNDLNQTIETLKGSIDNSVVYTEPGFLYPVIDVNGKKIKVFHYAFDLRHDKFQPRHMQDRDFENVTDQLEVAEDIYLIRWPGTNEGAVISAEDLNRDWWSVNDLTFDNILIEVMKAHNAWS